jgi:excisionase family DNA binding protein
LINFNIIISITLLLEVTGEYILAQIMTTKELAEYLRLHAITICKLSKEGKIPSVRIGSRWRFDKEVIDEWIAKG